MFVQIFKTIPAKLGEKFTRKLLEYNTCLEKYLSSRGNNSYTREAATSKSYHAKRQYVTNICKTFLKEL